MGLLLLAAVLAAVAGAVGCTRRGAAPGTPVPILMYHRIGDDPNDLWTVPRREFERQIKSLKTQGYETILPGDLAAGHALPAKPVILTFDDGYLSVKTCAEPILQKYGFHGISYLITSLVGDTPADRKQCEGHDCLTWPEVREINARGVIVFGGHSHQHVHLDQVAHPGTDIKTCFKLLAEKGGFRPDAFCYPFGVHNRTIMKAVAKAGFTTAMTADEATADSHNLTLLALPRLWVRGGRTEKGQRFPLHDASKP